MPKATGTGISAIFWTRFGGGGEGIEYRSSEVGDVSPEDIMVRFTGDVNSPTSDYLSGITIKINSVQEPFETADRQTNNRYVLYGNSTDFADANDVVTWEYDDDFGDLEDDNGVPVVDIPAQTVENRVGMHTYFDNDEELIWMAIL